MEMLQKPLYLLTEAPVRLDLKPERVQQLLAKLPGWALHPGGRALVRVRLFATEQGAGSFARKACWLGGKLLQPVTVRLAARRSPSPSPGIPSVGCTGGLTEAVFNLADLIG